jgi:hypothetical protein
VKERLRQEHELLIYANLDKYKPITRATKTVSWNVMVERVKYILGDEFNKIDAGRLELAQNLRNQMIHYDVVLEFPDVYHDFANLLNFVVEFHEKTLKPFVEESLHEKVDPELWREEENLYSAFYEHIVYFNEIFMTKALKDEILQEQERPHLIIDGSKYERIRYGSPDEYGDIEYPYYQHLCHDCAVIKGQIHLFGCDMERCPKCKNQLITCECDYEYPYNDSE